MLFRYELRKVMFTHKGAFILLICLLLKGIFLVVIPEMKDPRITLSHIQYDRYLALYLGEDSPEKQAYINYSYEQCKEILASEDLMQKRYSDGEISDEELKDYQDKLGKAHVRLNAHTMFKEKADQFAKQMEWNLPPASYIYEYGWRTVFSTHLLPDVFLLAGLLLLAARCFSFEYEDGMLPILLTAANGRRDLFMAKFSVLAAVSMVMEFAGAVMEVIIFGLRGFLKFGDAQLYSLTMFSEKAAVNLSLQEGYALILGLQVMASILFVLLIFAVSVQIKNTVHLLFVSLVVLVIGFFTEGVWSIVFAFTPSGLLMGSRFLMAVGANHISVLWPVLFTVAYVGVCVVLFMQMYVRMGEKITGKCHGKSRKTG